MLCTIILHRYKDYTNEYYYLLLTSKPSIIGLVDALVSTLWNAPGLYLDPEFPLHPWIHQIITPPAIGIRDATARMAAITKAQGGYSFSSFIALIYRYYSGTHKTVEKKDDIFVILCIIEIVKWVT